MSPVFRFFNARSGEHFYTNTRAERNGILAAAPDFRYEQGAFMTDGGQTVARFVRLDNGEHFYTADPVERDYIQANLSAAYRLESTNAFFVSSEPTSTATQAVYRFYDAAAGRHFFTASDAERDAVGRTLPNYRYEGIAYYAAPVPRSPTPAGSFDEAWYLQAYPDVRDAVNAGSMTAAQHYELFGRREGRMPSDMAALAGNDSWIPYDSAPGYVQVLNGGSGNDILDGIDDYGSAGGTLQGGWSADDDMLFGETGDDTLRGAQNDTLSGGSGNDYYDIHSGGVRVGEGRDAGTDTAHVRVDYVSGRYDYAIPANVELMRLSVSLYGVEAPVFTGSDGNDWIGNGTFGIATKVRLIGGAGNDTLNGGGGLDGGAVVEGGTGDDYLLAVGYYAQGRYDRAVGSRDDTLDGGSGNDTLVAWGGNDQLTGGEGDDVFLVDIGSPPRTLWQDPEGLSAYPTDIYLSTSWAGGTTTITDFSPGHDLIGVRHSALSLSDIMARFQDVSGALPSVQASFTTAELGLSLPGYSTPTNFTLSVQGFTTAQMSSSWFSVSSG